MDARRQLDVLDEMHLGAEADDAPGTQARHDEALVVAADVVEMQQVRRSRARRIIRIETPRMPGAVGPGDVYAEAEALILEVEGEDAVEARARQVQHAPMHLDLVAMFEIRITERASCPEPGIVDEQFVARRDVDLVAVKCDAAQAAVPAAAPLG